MDITMLIAKFSSLSVGINRLSAPLLACIIAICSSCVMEPHERQLARFDLRIAEAPEFAGRKVDNMELSVLTMITVGDEVSYEDIVRTGRLVHSAVLDRVQKLPVLKKSPRLSSSAEALFTFRGLVNSNDPIWTNSALAACKIDEAPSWSRFECGVLDLQYPEMGIFARPFFTYGRVQYGQSELLNAMYFATIDKFIAWKERHNIKVVDVLRIPGASFGYPYLYRTGHFDQIELGQDQ